MRYTLEIPTIHEPNALRVVLSDPSFIFPFIFPPVKDVKVEGNSFTACGKILGFSFCLIGNVYVSTESVRYAFTMSRGGSATLVFILRSGKVEVIFDFEGWMDSTSRLYIPRWLKQFKENFNEKVRLKRIEKKI